MVNNQYIRSLFSTIDEKNTQKFVSFIHHDGIFRFGNMPEVRGKEDVTGFIDNFFNSIKGLSHHELESWSLPGIHVINGRVTYERHNGSFLTVPFSVTLKMKGDLVKEYLVFSDNSELYNPES